MDNANQIPQKPKQGQMTIPVAIFLLALVVLFCTLSILVVYEKFFTINEETKTNAVENKVVDSSGQTTLKTDGFGDSLKYASMENGEEVAVHNGNLKDDYSIISSGYNTYFPSSNYLFVLKDNKIGLLDLKTKVVKNTSLPVLKNDDKYYESVNQIILSSDKSEAIIIIGLFDKNDKGGYGGPMSISTREIKYNLLTDKWENTQILESVRKIVGNQSISIVAWNNKKNEIFAYMHKTDPLESEVSAVAYVINLSAKTFRKTDGYYGSSQVFMNSNPDYFVIITKGELLFFDSNNLNKPIKTLNISKLSSKSIYSIDWFYPKRQIVVGTEKNIYRLNLDNNDIVSVYEDKTLGASYVAWSRFSLTFSPSGKYIVFVDFDNPEQASSGSTIPWDKDFSTVTAINIDSLEKFNLANFSGSYSPVTTIK